MILTTMEKIIVVLMGFTAISFTASLWLAVYFGSTDHEYVILSVLIGLTLTACLLFAMIYDVINE